MSDHEDKGLKSHFERSSSRERLLEHLFVGDLLRWLWQHGVHDVEVLRPEVDAGGYDLVIECNGVLRHVQLKASTRKGKAATQNINTRLADKPSGCIVWMKFDPETMELGPFLWFGSPPGKRLPALGEKVARRSTPNRDGVKPARANIRVLRKSKFKPLATMSALAQEMFGLERTSRSRTPAAT